MSPALSVKSVVLVSDTPDLTATFYRENFGIPLELERHRGTLQHWAGQLGDVHMAIHAREGFWLPTGPSAEPPGTIVTFTVEDLPVLEAHLMSRGVAVVARNQIGPMHFLAVRDPDHRVVCCGTPWRRSDA